MTNDSLSGIPLLPCPFCKEQAEIYNAIERRADADGTLQGHWVVDCTVCDASIEFCTSPENAAAKWNTRHYSPMGESLIEKLEALTWPVFQPNGPGSDKTAIYVNNTLDKAISIVRQHQAEAVCPYIVTSDEGTSYCRLAEQNGPAPAEQPQDVVERVANALIDDGRFGNRRKAWWIEGTPDAIAKAAIAAMGEVPWSDQRHFRVASPASDLPSEMLDNADDGFPEEKLRNVMLAHLDGVYRMSARANCDRLVTQIIKRYLRSPVPEKCPDCGADMIEVCGGLEELCKRQPEPVMVDEELLHNNLFTARADVVKLKKLIQNLHQHYNPGADEFDIVAALNAQAIGERNAD
jgi:hypothetical protein